MLSAHKWPAWANGINRNGYGGQSMSMGGTGVAWANDPLSAMGANPAGLGFLDSTTFSANLVGALPEGHFVKSPTADGRLDESPRAFPEAALAFPLKHHPVTLGLSVIPESMMTGDWYYHDSPGGLGGAVSYGPQKHKSEIKVLRSALGLGAKLNEQWSIGASVGLVYNENTLVTPYTFQNLSPNPNSLNGAKTLLDLHTTGFGWNLQAGAIYRATTNLQFGLTYKSETRVDTDGDASGDPYAQFAVAPGPLAFHYDAGVQNTFPQEIDLGMSWKFRPQWRLALEIDWINWSGAFKNLPVTLRNGNNATVNSVLGANVDDSIPMNWRDQFVYRAGIEYAATERLSLRAGYSYGEGPTPDNTLSPMTACIMEHTLTAGVGYKFKRVDLDLAYQYDLPVKRTVRTSTLLSGEYSNSSTEVSLHWVALTATIRF